MPEFSSLSELEKYLNGLIRSSLENEVTDIAKQTMQEKVITDVYDKYESQAKNKYQRTGDLYQDKNIQSTMVDDNTLEIKNITTDDKSGRLVAPVVEEGQGYEWKRSEIYQKQPFPRPFIEETAKELEDGLAVVAMKEGLKKQGLSVE